MTSRTRRRGGGCLVAFVVLLVVLLGAAYGADRYAHQEAERRVAAQVQQQLGLASEPGVSIDGFPFLTQVAAGAYPHVHLSATRVPTGGQKPMTVERLEVDLNRVRTVQGVQQITAGELSGTASMTWAEVSRVAGVPVRPEPGGRVAVTARLKVLGQQAEVDVSARPALDVATQTLVLQDPEARVADYHLPADVVRSVVQQELPRVPLALPLGLRAQSVTAGEGGPVLALAGTDVRLTN